MRSEPHHRQQLLPRLSFLTRLRFSGQTHEELGNRWVDRLRPYRSHRQLVSVLHPHPGEPVNSTRTRRSKFEKIDAALKTWFDGIKNMGGADLPMTMAVLETRAREIATELGVEGFFGSPEFIQPWASRHRLRSVKLWGQAGSAAESGRLGEWRMAEIRAELATYDPEHIYNMDETGLQYRCLPNRSYIAAGTRRRARGSKEMNAKDRVTLVLA